MSAREYRDLVYQRINEVLHGAEGNGGICSTTLSGAPKDYAVYRDMVGQIRAYHAVFEIMATAYRDLFDPIPASTESKKSQGDS